MTANKCLESFFFSVLPCNKWHHICEIHKCSTKETPPWNIFFLKPVPGVTGKEHTHASNERSFWAQKLPQWSRFHRSLKIKIGYLTTRWSHERRVRKIIQSSLTLRYLYHWSVHPIAQRCFQAVKHNRSPIERSTRSPIKRIDVKTAILHEQCMRDSVHTHTTWIVLTENVLLNLLESKKKRRFRLVWTLCKLSGVHPVRAEKTAFSRFFIKIITISKQTKNFPTSN